MAVENYEAMIVYSVKEGEDAAKALVEKFKALMEKHGTVESVDEWGKKRLAYEIQKMKEAYYYFIHFDAEATCPAEVEKRVRIMEPVIRYLCVKEEA